MTQPDVDVVITRTFADPGAAAWETLLSLCCIVPAGEQPPSIHVEIRDGLIGAGWREAVATVSDLYLDASAVVVADTNSLGTNPTVVLMCSLKPELNAFVCEAVHVCRVVNALKGDRTGRNAVAASRQFNVAGRYVGPRIDSLALPRLDAPATRRFPSLRRGRSRPSHDLPSGPLLDDSRLAELDQAYQKLRLEQRVTLMLDPALWQRAERIVRREYAVSTPEAALVEVCNSFHRPYVDYRDDVSRQLLPHEFGLTSQELEDFEIETESQELDSVSQYARLMIAAFVTRHEAL